MDKMNIKINGRVLSIAILLITGRAKTTRLPINPVSILNGIGWLFQLVLNGVNSHLTNVARFSLNWNTAALSLLTGDTIIAANPVRANLSSNNVTGNGLNSNTPFSIKISTNSPKADVFSDLSDIGYFRHRFS